jgi:hypothetical protein
MSHKTSIPETPPQHTATPWKLQKPSWARDIYIYECGKDITTAIAQVFGHQVDDGEAEAIAHARRIVDCVNACAGMSDPAAEIEAMREALRCIADEPCDHGPGFCPRETARAALDTQPPAAPSFRIIGYYEDNGQRFDDEQTGMDWQEALNLSTNECDQDNLCIVAIIDQRTGASVDIGEKECTVADLLGEVGA